MFWPVFVVEIGDTDDREGPPFPLPKVDRFGFVQQETGSPDGFMRTRSASEYEREERRIRKWRKMIGVGGNDWKHYVRRKPHVINLWQSGPPFIESRIWDVFLSEGVKIVFKVGLALLKYCHDDLVKLPFEKLMLALHNFPEDSMKYEP